MHKPPTLGKPEDVRSKAATVSSGGQYVAMMSLDLCSSSPLFLPAISQTIAGSIQLVMKLVHDRLIEKRRKVMSAVTPTIRRKEQGITLTKLQAQIAAMPAGKERTALRRDLRHRGLLGPRPQEVRK